MPPRKQLPGGFVYAGAGGGGRGGAAPKADAPRLSSAGMTYAGLKSMIYAGLKPDDPRVKAAIGYIRSHYTLDENPGQGQGGLYYYYHTFAKAMSLHGEDPFKDAEGTEHHWRSDLVAALAKRQDENGSWVNKSDRFMEGDPNIVTDKHPAVLSALAAVESAQRNLAKTVVVAPADGTIANVASLNVGQYVGPGTTIASLVESNGVWVEANFKETQLADLKVGQPAEVKVDAYGNSIECSVGSLGAATGSEFSLIPAQNATGNWVKVVQRLPVRIECPSGEQVAMLKTGMSATVTVDTGRSTLDKLMGK